MQHQQQNAGMKADGKPHQELPGVEAAPVTGEPVQETSQSNHSTGELQEGGKRDFVTVRAQACLKQSPWDSWKQCSCADA